MDVSSGTDVSPLVKRTSSKVEVDEFGQVDLFLKFSRWPGLLGTFTDNKQSGSHMKALKLHCEYYLMPWNELHTLCSPAWYESKLLHKYTCFAYEVNHNQEAKPSKHRGTWNATNAKRDFTSSLCLTGLAASRAHGYQDGITQAWTIVCKWSFVMYHPEPWGSDCANRAKAPHHHGDLWHPRNGWSN